MPNKRIQFTLRERFAAPLPEFYRRRIVFWKDEEREFEHDIDELDLPGVKIVKLTGSNNFSVKKLLLHDDLEGDYLIYSPLTYADEQDNWLQDIEYYSEVFRADFVSMQMDELNIEPTAVMRKSVKLYAKFLENQERRRRLRAIGHEYRKPLPLHIDILSVLAGVPGGSMQDILIALLSAGLDRESNEVLQNIAKFGSLPAFWTLVYRYTGYQDEEERPLWELAAHLLLTALSQTMNVSVLKGLERFLSDTGKAYCYGLVHEWRGRSDNDTLFETCRAVERELRLPARFAKLEPETLLTGDVFPCINESLLSQLFREVGEQVVRTDLILRVCENRRTAGWYDRLESYFDCLFFLGKMALFHEEHAAGFHFAQPREVWNAYTDDLYRMDAYYRHFYHAFGRALTDANEVLEDALKHTTGYVEGLYQNWFLRELTACWTNTAADDLAALGYVSEINRQRDFYRRYVSCSKSARVFVVISDALRYEVASELSERLNRTTKGAAELTSMQAVFPSITKFGMAALLPGLHLSANENMEALMDGKPTRSTAERSAVLESAAKPGIAVQYTELLGMKKAERRERVAGRDVVYIYHNAIDAIGDKAPTERKVFDACETALDELSGIVRMVTNDLGGSHIIITADHGFLYTHDALSESDKLSRAAFSGEVLELGRRYALTSPDTTADYLLPVNLDRELSGAPVKGYAPQGAVRMKVQGGGENYVHGGISLEEMVVPVLLFKNLRASSRDYVEVTNAEIKLLTESRKAANLMFPLEFYQVQPCGDKVQPCTYTIYMTDENGEPVSDRQKIIADKSSPNANERAFRIRLSLKALTYDAKKTYHLVIASDTDRQEIDFCIDVAFSGDFGFDL